MSESTKFGEHKVVFNSGGPDMPEPIGLKLVPIYEAFDVNFYTVLDQQISARCVHSQSFVGARKNHVKKALKEYPRLKNAMVPVDPEVRIPLTWPVGTYGLPMPKSGCPKGITFPWHVGTRYHDTEDGSANNRWSTPYHLAGKVSKSNMEQKFCMKTQRTFGISWPKGKYCILKKGPCPQGFQSGYIKWMMRIQETRTVSRVSFQRAYMTATLASSTVVVWTDSPLMSLSSPPTPPSSC
ncbi:hypothetical protein OS493_019662 [Desmophyllum pertusum]|uniref:Apextrin C-terminal domain-containing protein n=1 Tax=Desmophyllum pertusum TaxID=174260 RepID=A0A9W9ZBZ0_9CNID|nr:hypothetical protein OS493_019662 [Desmophyllum pertusum]